MASTKEIRSKIKSVQNTRKITKAMEMVAASKMRRAQERMRNARPYAEKIREIVANLSKANPEFRPAYMATREVKKAGTILVTTDKGLCGGLNTVFEPFKSKTAFSNNPNWRYPAFGCVDWRNYCPARSV